MTDQRLETPAENPEPAPRPPGDRVYSFVCMLLGLPLALFGGVITLAFLLLLFGYVANRLGGGPPQADAPPGTAGALVMSNAKPD